MRPRVPYARITCIKRVSRGRHIYLAQKQYMLLNLILSYYDKGNEALDAEIPFSKLVSLPVREQIGRFKYVQESEADSRYDAIVKEMDAQIRSLNGGEQEYA